MFYGEGAGTRRKLIRETIKQRSKDETYKKEFDKALAEQDMSKHAAKARSERKRKDAKKFAGKTARGAYHVAAKDGANVSAFVGTAAAAIAGAGVVMRATGADKKLYQQGKVIVEKVMKRRR